MKSHPKSFAPPADGLRVKAINDHPARDGGDFVLYWMIATRRPTCNFALDRAVEWARHFGRPLLILEALRVDYPGASDRLHRFVIDGMAANARRLQSAPVTYYPYVEPRPGAGKGLLERLAAGAIVVITDDYPCFFLPHAIRAAGKRLDVRLESVDSNGILPLGLADRAFTAAVHFRRYMQRHLREHLTQWPKAEPFKGVRLPRLRSLPSGLRRKWPPVSRTLLAGDPVALKRLPIDHAVPVVSTKGGWDQGRRALKRFVATRLAKYHEAHNHPDDHGTSRLSPYLHFGHISPHEIFDAVMRRQRWSARKLGAKATGQREGWWHVDRGAEAFLDQLVVWRELAFNTCAKRPDDYDRFDALPPWALKTLQEHECDVRSPTYAHWQFEEAATHDPVWNAAQRQMRCEGWFHNYMRMLWGKKILEWSATPRDALATMAEIMNRWSLDGRDPNAYAGYMWTLGRYDRPWPERAIFGKVRSMSSASTARKVRLKRYLEDFGA